MQNNSKQQLTFVDLFAGIGGFRIALENLGLKCVFSSEKDLSTAKLYELNYGENPLSDITKIDAKNIPDFDILCAGFPCQSFSIAGKKKGFEDSRGTMFFEICRILKEKSPEIVLLENVKNLSIHNNGDTLNTIITHLETLGYIVSWEILNAKDFGIPQNRERTIIVGLKNCKFDFSKLRKTPIENMKPFLENKDFKYISPTEYTLIDSPKKQPKSGLMFCGYMNKRIRTKGVTNANLNLSRVHKQPNRIYSVNGIHPTLSSQEISGRYFILTERGVRKLTIDECFRFMGFPESFKKEAKLTVLYKCIGNSVAVPMIQEIMEQILVQTNLKTHCK